MSAILAVLRLAWPYLLTVGISAFISHELDQIPYDRLQTSLASYKEQVADANVKAQKAAADALQEQITTRLTTEARNGQIISQLTQERDSAAADRDFARRLLAAAQAVPAPPSHPSTAAAGGPATPVTPQPPGDRSLAADLGAAAGECRDAIQRLAALQAEVAPQLTR